MTCMAVPASAEKIKPRITAAMRRARRRSQRDSSSSGSDQSSSEEEEERSDDSGHEDDDFRQQFGPSTTTSAAIKEANANCVTGHRRQFLAELVVATIVADGAEGNTCCSVSHCAVRLSDPSQLA